MPSSVAVFTAMLSTPTPNLPYDGALLGCPDNDVLGNLGKAGHYRVGVPCQFDQRRFFAIGGPLLPDAPPASNTARSGSVEGQTWSVIRTFQVIRVLLLGGGDMWLPVKDGAAI